MTSVSWYRRRCWQIKGKREYTKSGYEQASNYFNSDDLDVECSDRHFLITGANSGIGLQIALDIGRRGGVLHLVCRNRLSMTEARSHIITTTGNDKIHLHTLDLSRPQDVCRWANDFVSSHDKLDVLINNAGVIATEKQTDEDGIEATFAVHCLSPHILTFTLLPLLQRSPDARIITVSSGAMLKVKLDPYDLLFEKMDPYDGVLACSQTKRQQVVLNLIYAQMHDSVRFYCAHPGWVDTPSIKRYLPEFYEEVKANLRNTRQGADTIVWLAVSNAALRYPSGHFFQDRAPVSTHLPLAWTKHSLKDEQLLFKKLNCLLLRVSPSESHVAVENAAYGYTSYLNSKQNSKVKSDEDSLVKNESNHSLSSLDHNSITSDQISTISIKSEESDRKISSDPSEPSSIIMGIPEHYDSIVPYPNEADDTDSLHRLEVSPFDPFTEYDSSPEIDPSPMQTYLRDRLESIPEAPDEQSMDNHVSDKSMEPKDENSMVLDSRRRPVIIPYHATETTSVSQTPTQNYIDLSDDDRKI